ncbi:MAG: methionine--tRNA ligase [Kiritimatiellae bacterium]|nr:methionine--tRNA ligase [Kiritimatiellia bacterium]
MKNRFYVTTPIYYVNDRPHIGHAYTTILADVLARYHRLMHVPTFFLTGTDEHGQKVARAARLAGISPQEQADRTVVRFQELWQKLEISNDDFIRTTESRHTQVVQKALQMLFDRGEIYRAEYDGWYCVTCERFFTEKDLANGKCPEPACGREVERVKEFNYFFRMSQYQDWLVDYIQQHPRFIQPDFRRNETLGFLRKKLEDLCISRPKKRLDWGIELPFDRDYVTYVWFDALLNYVTAVGYLTDDVKFAKWWPASCHLIGKDILTTHTVYWPTILKALGLPMPEMVFAHGWWLVGREKMSKSSGNVIDPMLFIERFGVDAFRYFLMAEMALGQDASFTEESFVRRYHADLANDLGNMVNRILKLVITHFNGLIPPPAACGEDEARLQDATLRAAKEMVKAVEKMAIEAGLSGLMSAVREGNRYLEKKQPWVLAKQSDLSALGTVLYTAAESLRIVSGMLYPVMPNKMSELRRTLGVKEAAELADLTVWGGLKPGTRVATPGKLFPKMEERIAVTAKDHSEVKEQTDSMAAGVQLAEYADFRKLELRTAVILSAERVPGTEKLLRLEIEMGAQKRQIVAGIAQHYTPESLKGKTIVVVANLRPTRIRGIESQGMLLAASDAEHVRLVTIDGNLPSGSVVR